LNLGSSAAVGSSEVESPADELTRLRAELAASRVELTARNVELVALRAQCSIKADGTRDWPGARPPACPATAAFMRALQRHSSGTGMEAKPSRTGKLGESLRVNTQALVAELERSFARGHEGGLTSSLEGRLIV